MYKPLLFVGIFLMIVSAIKGLETTSTHTLLIASCILSIGGMILAELREIADKLDRK